MLNPCKISVNFLLSPAKKHPDGFTLSGCFLPIKSLQFPNTLLRRAEKAEHGGHIDQKLVAADELSHIGNVGRLDQALEAAAGRIRHGEQRNAEDHQH